MRALNCCSTRIMSTTTSSIDDAVTQSAAKLGIELKEKQREALLAFCEGKDVFVSLPTGYGKSIIFALLPMVFNILNGNSYIYLDCLVTLYCYYFRCDKQYCCLCKSTHCNNAGTVGEVL